MIPISLCMITKNESDKLDRCLAAVKDLPLEIIVVDTGSTDNSIEDAGATSLSESLKSNSALTALNLTG